MKRPIALHPVLLGVASALSLYSESWQTVPPVEAVLGVAASAVLMALAWAAFQLLLRDARKSAFATSAFLLLFYSYGEVYHKMSGGKVGEGEAPRHLLLLAVYLLVLLGVVWIVRRLPADLARATVIANVVAAVMVAVPLAVSLFGLASRALEPSRPDEERIAAAGSRLPDIYYIVPDGYARADVMREVFGWDNRAFLDSLEAKGFHVDGASFSNYDQTYLSLAATLNLSYLQDLEILADLDGTAERSRGPLIALIDYSRLAFTLRELGYKVVTFPSGYSATGFGDADIVVEGRWTPSEFQDALIAATPIPGLLEVFGGGQGDWHRHRIENVLDKLDSLADRPGGDPIFVIAHVFAPHPPFVFDAAGAPTPEKSFFTGDGTHFFARGGTREEYVAGYRAQAEFLSGELDAAIGRVLEKSATPPIIVLQSDHGSGLGMDWESLERTDLRERFAILSALYLPGFDTRRLPPGMSPVNTFRVVLDLYFDADLPLLPDRSFYTTWTHPYRHVEVTDRLR